MQSPSGPTIDTSYSLHGISSLSPHSPSPCTIYFIAPSWFSTWPILFFFFAVPFPFLSFSPSTLALSLLSRLSTLLSFFPSQQTYHLSCR